MLAIKSSLSVGRQVASKLQLVSSVCFSLLSSGITIDKVGHFAELITAVRTLNGLNIFTISLLAEKPIYRFFKSVFGFSGFLKTDVGSVVGFFKTAVLSDLSLCCGDYTFFSRRLVNNTNVWKIRAQLCPRS